MKWEHTVKDRFLRYVTYDTESDPLSLTSPSTEKQKILSRLLVEELLQMGITDAHLDEYGVVYATIPSNSKTKVPAIAFCSHVDTSPDCSGANVRPIVHENYRGKDIKLPDNPSIIIRMKDHPDLKSQIGNDIITASGTTLLGADNKGGVAAIMDAANLLMKNPQIIHGDVKIIFTPDEEIGRGVDNVNVKKLAADFAYTIDGETAGSIEDETFSADGAEVTILGVPSHPGFAKGKMVSALKIASMIVSRLPNKLSPEFTIGKQGFIHPTSIEGGIEKCTIKFILRDFDDRKLKAHGVRLKKIVKEVIEKFPKAKSEVTITEQYRNMNKVLKKNPQVVKFALEALKRSGFKKPILRSIRGGTDGSRLSYMGLPCPNLFAGEHAFHSPYEWVSVQDLEKATETIIHLVQIWAENS